MMMTQPEYPRGLILRSRQLAAPPPRAREAATVEGLTASIAYGTVAMASRQTRSRRSSEPFFTKKKDAMGIGLSICRSLMVSMDGTISGRNHETGGAVFECRFVAAPGEDDNA